MVEAISSLAPSRAQRQAQRQAQAVRVLAMLAAKREVKDRLRREGKKLSKVPRREIERLARDRVMADAAYRAGLIAEAERVVEEWRIEGFFGKQAALSVRNVPELRTLLIGKGHEEREIQR